MFTNKACSTFTAPFTLLSREVRLGGKSAGLRLLKEVYIYSSAALGSKFKVVFPTFLWRCLFEAKRTDVATTKQSPLKDHLKQEINFPGRHTCECLLGSMWRKSSTSEGVNVDYVGHPRTLKRDSLKLFNFASFVCCRDLLAVEF